MKYLLILTLLSIGINSNAQSTKTYKRSSYTNKTKSSSSTSKPLTTKDRIELRIRDSAAAANNIKTQSSPQEINGIRVGATPPVNSTSTTTNTTVTAPLLTNGQVQAIQGNTITNNAGAGRAVTSNPVANKPITNEQSQYNTTDVNRNQLNVINQNQNASAAQNPASKTWGQNTIGESQWGQNQVGENQWTPPPANITTSFSKDFPTIRGATWSMDNNNYTARYKLGDWWTTSSYNANGVRMDTRTEIPVTGVLPQAIISFRGRQKLPVDFTRISRVERPGKPEVYEIRLNNGSLVYVNALGADVVF